MKGCIRCKHCYFVLGSAYCTSKKFRATKISDKQLYHKKGYCSGFEEKEDVIHCREAKNSEVKKNDTKHV